MKAVLISIQPQHCVNITSGRKRIEVRKKRPTCKVPFKAFIYCTSVKSLPLKEYVALHALTGGLCDKWNGKVIGEFVCDEIIKLSADDWYVFKGDEKCPVICGGFVNDTCITPEEADKYLGNSLGYGLHISDLKIYDKPKEIGEFYKPCPFPSEDCDLLCPFAIGEYHGDGINGDMEFIDCGNKITRPPQSYTYVEVIQ